MCDKTKEVTTEDKKEGKTPMTDEERRELAKKLDDELDDFISGLEKRQYTEGWPEDRWEEEMDKHPFFMKKAPEPGEKLHPLLEGIQQLKYDPDENSAEDLATSYKEDGNFNFKHKNYRLAILSYTEGIKQIFDNVELKASLLNNRAASHYFLKNYRSSLRDCQAALKLNPNYDKVIIRAANCCYETSQFDKCVEYCDEILLKRPESKDALTLRQKAVNTKKNIERNLRKNMKVSNKKKSEESAIIKEILSRGIQLSVKKDALSLQSLEPKCPQLQNERVFINEENKLVWPIALLYPEYKLTEFIQKFSEDGTIEELMLIVFAETANWDSEKKYNINNINVYFEDRNKTKLYNLELNKTLKEILAHKAYVISGGTPTFIVTAKNSQAERQFLSNYS